MDRRNFMKLSGALALAGAAPAGARAASGKIKVGYLHTLAVDGQIWLAESKGLWKKNGLDLEFIQFQTGLEVFQAMTGGSIDVLSTGAVVSNFPARGQGKVFLINDVEFATAQLWVHPEIKSFADLKGKKSAQSLTSNFGKLAEASGAQLVGTDGFDQSIQLVLNGRADATVNDSLSFLDFKKHKPDANVKIAATQDNADQSGIIVRKGEAKLVAAINDALTAIKADGTYAAISQKYFGADVSK